MFIEKQGNNSKSSTWPYLIWKEMYIECLTVKPMHIYYKAKQKHPQTKKVKQKPEHEKQHIKLIGNIPAI